MKRLYRLLLLGLLAGTFACSDTPDGEWTLHFSDGTTESWEISGDTIQIDQGGLFQRRGIIFSDPDGQQTVQLSTGMYAMEPLEGEEGYQLSPEPGSPPEVLHLKKSDAGNDPLQGVLPVLQLPHLSAAMPYAGNKYALLFYSDTSKAQQPLFDYALQLGAHHKAANRIDIQPFLAEANAAQQHLGNQQPAAVLYMHADLPMEEVYRLTTELRVNGYFEVVYGSDQIMEQGRPHGIKRNLFLLSFPESERQVDPAISVEGLRSLSNRRSDFYDRLYRDTTAVLLHATASEGTVRWNGNRVENAQLKGKIVAHLSALAEGQQTTTIIVTADAQASYGQYMDALNSVTAAYQEVRDAFCQQAFNMSYQQVMNTRQDAAQINRMLLQKYPEKIVEVTPLTHQFYNNAP